MTPNRLHNLRADEISVVARAATGRKFLLFKTGGAVDELAVYEAAEVGDVEALRELAALADHGDTDALEKLQELADAGDDNAAQLLTELDATVPTEANAMKPHDTERRATLLRRVERERVAEVARTRQSALTKAMGPDPVDGVMIAIHVVEKGDAPAVATIAAEKDRRKMVLGQHDPFLSPSQRSARVEKSAAGSCLSAIANDPRAATLDLRTLLEALVTEGNGDLVTRTAYELRGS